MSSPYRAASSARGLVAELGALIAVQAGARGVADDLCMCDAAEPTGPRDSLVGWLDQYDEPVIREIGDGSALLALPVAPGAISISGAALRVSVSLGRDFMPISPPDGKPLTARVQISATATAGLAPSPADRIAVIHDRQAWIAPLIEETPWDDSSRVVIARNGPKWGPSITVDVVLELHDAEGQAYLIRVPGTEIQESG
jgi:hypothetical protein